MTDTRARRLFGGEMEAAGASSLGVSPGLPALGRAAGGAWAASGRGALFLVLESLKSRGVRCVHLPAFLCESVLLPARALGLDVSFFPVDEALGAHPEPPAGAAVVLIHYFGWLNPAADALRRQTGPAPPLVEDFSHALLSDWGRGAPPGGAGDRYSFFSARKLAPVPLGGWCSVEAGPGEPSTEMELAAWRSLAARLVKRDYLATPNAPADPRLEQFYLAAFEAVESFLDRRPEEWALPPFALDWIGRVDWDEIAKRRCRNWRRLHELLAESVDPVARDLPSGTVPLGYMIRLRPDRRDVVRRALADRRVFCPAHWPLPGDVDPRRFPEARRLSESLLALPIDQRYDESAMEILAQAVKRALERA